MKNTDIGLQGRFLLGLAVILFFCSLVSACFIYFWGKQTLEDEALKRTELVLAAVDAVRGYVREELRPKMYDILGHDRFVLEAMSASYVSRAVMERLRQRLPEFRYRRVSLFPLNPEFLVDDAEKEMLRYFASHPGLKEWEGIKPVDGQPYYMRFEPITYGESCLRCHQDSAGIPTAIRDHYRQARFVPDPPAPPGLVSIGIPIDTSLIKVKDRAFSVFIFAFAFIIFLYSIIAFFFDRVVIQSLRGLLALFRDNLRDEKGLQLYEMARSRDAINEITRATEAMADYIRQTERQLADHACNLEQLVEERTAALRLSRKQLQEKVRARNRELHTLNSIAELITRSPDLTATLPEILRHALAVVPARGAAIYLATRENDIPVLELQCAENAIDLPSRTDRAPYRPGHPQTLLDALAEAAAGQMSFLASENEGLDSLSVPLSCRSQVHGVMVFTAVDFMELDQETTALLSSVGQQIGILIESMKNIHRLMQTATLLQTVFDGITDPVALLDRYYRIRMVNRAFLDRYNVRDTDVTGRDCRDFADCPFAGAALAQFQPGAAVSRLERLAGGEIFEVHFYPLFENSNQLANIVCYGKDVTEQKLAEERSQHTEKMAAIGQLAAGIAHEINNPLGVILCYTDLARGDIGDDQRLLQDLDIVEKHANTCKRIVSGLLQFARGTAALKRPVSPGSIIQEVVDMISRQLEKERIRIQVSLDDTTPDMELDSDRMKQVILNLLINAAQAIGADGLIRITCRKQNAMVRIAVEDDGPGIPPSIIDKIFDPFFSTKEPGKGTGLGLSVSYGIVRDHGGDIRAANRPEGGAVIEITLPAASGENT